MFNLNWLRKRVMWQWLTVKFQSFYDKPVNHENLLTYSKKLISFKMIGNQLN